MIDEGGETKLGLGVAAAAGVGAEVLSTSIISESISIEPMVTNSITQDWMVGFAGLEIIDVERVEGREATISSKINSGKIREDASSFTH